METRVYRIPTAKAVKIVEDEDVKRYGEAKRYEPAALDLKGDDAILAVKGAPDLFKKEIFEGLEETKDKELILKKIEEMSQSAASGIGNLFG